MLKNAAAGALTLLCLGAGFARAEETGPFKPTSPSGYFFVGGRYETANNRTTALGQMFVENRAPERVTQPYPVVMVHGTAQTGTNFLGTPDGRSGWADRFAAKGFAVYVVDQVGRGRSGGDAETYGPYARLPMEDLETVFTGQERSALYPQAKLHTQWPGGPGLRGNAAFDQFYRSQVPYIASALKSEELVDPALISLLEKIGPAIVLTHSQAGVFGWAVSDQRPDLVKAHVAVEPNGPTFFDIRFKGGADWYERVGDARARPYGITRVPLHFDPPVSGPTGLTVVQAERAEGPDQIRCWLQAEPARTLPNLAKVPAVIVTAEASFRATMDDCTAAFLTQAGAKPDRLALAEHGIHGNSHMMMLESNSDQVADAIVGWIEARTSPGKPRP
ncbi:alpha/beta hydrolase [Methylobacterium pseudosasicola]|uniref:Alpha/beta hydrolase family protein n=1 Tax=Methylobacterium pseudosasicola TaxID=582667 RepID=A0A1I4J516_9HYPH|nr:alpha/beta hydrolase [Methylobacterium pseudosasicola]SFL61692.1 Alpha/beta hydrolase family protein [Methylobacterium pseudosasicola]